MRVLLQRVRCGSVKVDHQTIGEIERGLVVLLGIGATDQTADADKLADKIVHLRIFCDENGNFQSLAS